MPDQHDPLEHLRDQEEHPHPHFDAGHGMEHEVEHEIEHKPQEEAEKTLRDQAVEHAVGKAKEHAKGAVREGAKRGGQQLGESAAQSGLGAGAGTGATGAAAGAGAAGAEGAAAAGAAGAGAAGAAGTAGATGIAGAAGAAGAATAPETAGAGAVVGAAVAGLALVGAYALKHKVQVAVVAFIGVLTVVVGGLLFLNALRPIASTLSAATKYLAPVQQIVDNRGISILSRFVTGGASAVSDAGQSADVAAVESSSGHVLGVTTDGPVTNGSLKLLYDAMKKDGFEQRIKKNFGLEFRSNGAGGGVQIVQNGNDLGTVHDAAQAEKILRDKFTDLRRLMDEEMRGWDWAQHTQIGRPAKAAFSIPGLAIPGAEDATSPEQLTDVVKSQIGTILRPGIDGLHWALSCFLSGQGCSQDSSVTASVTAESAYQDKTESSIQNASDKAYDENMGAITPENNYTTSKLGDTAGQKITEAFSKNSPAIVMLGWLDMATTIYKGKDDPAYSHVTSDLRSKQAGALFLWNLSAVNQSGAGDASSPSSSLIFRNYANIEESQAYNYVAYDDTSRGKPMGEDEKVNSMLPNPMSTYFKSFASLIAFAPLKLAMEIWYKIRSIAEPVIMVFASQPLATFFSTRFFGALKNTALGDYIDNIFKLPSKVLLPICDPAEKNFNFFNCMGTGAHALANFACARFGCGPVTLAQENELKYASQSSNAATVANLPLEKRLFDRMQPGSFINVAALKSPVAVSVGDNLATAIQGIFAAVWSTPRSIAAMAAQPAMAASADSSAIDGIEHMGIPLQTLQTTPLSPELFDDSGDCKTTPTGQTNICTADFSTVDALYARYTHNPEGSSHEKQP